MGELVGDGHARAAREKAPQAFPYSYQMRSDGLCRAIRVDYTSSDQDDWNITRIGLDR